MKKYVISIIRQFGSLGRPIARKMSELLDIEYYDRDIVYAVAKQTGYPIEEISTNDEMLHTGFLRMMFPLGQSSAKHQNEIFNTQRKVILEAADRESCIVVGRCSDYILEAYPNLLRIYIYAPYEKRLKNCVEELHMAENQAKRMIRGVDRARNAYHKRYAGFAPNDMNYKDLMIDSSMLGVDGTAEYLVDLIHKKFDDKE